MRNVKRGRYTLELKQETDFRLMLNKHGIAPSMSRKGNCWDNAVTEILFGSLKVERLHGERFTTI